MVLVKNLPTSSINTLTNYGGEILYNSSINHPIVNITSGFKKFVLSTLDDNITGIASFTATNLTGTLQTAAQPNVTSLGTLTSLTVNNTLTIADHDGSTTGLILGSTLVTSTGDELNYLDTTPGTAEANKALVTDSNNSIVGLTNLETDNLTVNGTLVTASAIELNYTDVSTIGIAQASKALVVDENLDIIGIHNLETDNLTVNGTLVTASAIELNYTDVSTIGIAEAGKALVFDGNRDIVNIHNLEAENLTGTLQTAAQPNITSVGTLTSLDIAGSLTVSGIEIGGVSLTPADTGAVRVRIFSSNDFNGRVIANENATSIDFTNYAPAGQSNNYSMEVWGYIQPLYTEAYTFILTANDHVRFWINNQLLITQWSTGDHTSVQTIPVNLVANQWYPIYIQHRQDTSTERLSLSWQSTSQTTEIIPTVNLAYDNREISVSTRQLFLENTLTFYDNTNGNQSHIYVNNSGDLLMSSYTSVVNIEGHDGSTTGLQLNGNLVTATATELNYTDTTPGTIEASKALIVDAGRNITNLNDITSTGSLEILGTSLIDNNTNSTDTITGALVVSGGVGIGLNTNIGGDLTVVSNTYLNSDLFVTGPILSLPTGTTAQRPSTPQVGYVRYNSQTSQFEGFGAGNSWGSLGGVSDVNQDTRILAEDGAGTNDDNLRFFNNASETMRLTAVGKLGLGTNAPDMRMEINDADGDCLRLTYNDNDGTATYYADFTINAIGELTLNSSGDTIFIHASDNLDIAGHNGSTMGLLLNGTLVTATATELNYTDTTPGTIEASKALIVDSSRDITNINNITSTGNLILTGTSTINDITNSTSSITGALIVAGGVGINQNLYVGSDLNVTDNTNIGLNLDVNGSVDVAGAVLFQNNLQVDGTSELNGVVTINNTTSITNNTDSSSTSTGSLVVTGGVGIGLNTNIGGDLTVVSNTYLNSDLFVTGPILSLPTGTTAQRPSTPQVGYVRYNSQTSQFEGFGAGNSWGSLGGVSDVNQDTRILAEDGAGTNDDNLRFFNNASETMRLTAVGKLGLGTNAPDMRMEINDADGDCLRLTYNDNDGTATYYADFTINASGELTLNSSGNTIFIHSSDNFNIVGHDGSTMGLLLNNILVTATATELNYTDTTPGTAEASKALIVDSSRDITNINNLSTAILNTHIDNATGNTIAYPITITRTTSDTPANGLGAGIEFYIENSNNDNVAYGSLEISANDITDASEDGKFSINLLTAGLSTTALTLTHDELIVVELVETSDVRVKENIVSANIEDSYTKIMSLDLVDYNFIHDKEKKTHRGLIAQELKNIIPNAVHIGENNDIEDFHSVSTKELVGYMIGSLQHMDKKYKELEKKYIDLELKYNSLLD